MDRRLFLGLFGCGVIGLATDWSGALRGVAATPAPLTGWGRATTLQVVPPDGDPGGVYRLSRTGVGSSTLVQMAVAPRSYFVWQAVIGGELVFREGAAGLELTVQPYDAAGQLGSERLASAWELWWAADRVASVTGCEYCGTAYFAWPAGGNCTRCGGRLPPPLANPSGRYVTQVRDGVRTIYPVEPLQTQAYHRCPSCGTVRETAGAPCANCGDAR